MFCLSYVLDITRAHEGNGQKHTIVEKIHFVFKYSFPCPFRKKKKKNWFIINLNRIPCAKSKLLMPLGESQPLSALQRAVETHPCGPQTEGKLVPDG